MSVNTLKVINKLLNLIETFESSRWKIKNEMRGLKLIPMINTSGIEEVFEDGDSNIVIRVNGTKYTASEKEYPSQYSQIHSFMNRLINKTLSK